jgi:hypothetical protein
VRAIRGSYCARARGVGSWLSSCSGSLSGGGGRLSDRSGIGVKNNGRIGVGSSCSGG